MNYAGLIAGLGNPGDKYKGTRHNCGFIFIDQFLNKAGELGAITVLNGKKFNAELWSVTLPGLRGKWLACKPQTFMNDSGRAIQPILAWHNLKPEQLVVAQDELDIPAGSLRFKFGGGLAGHNGLRSIKECLGTPDFYRLRIGTGKPACKDDILNWVLGRPDKLDREKLSKVMPAALETFLFFSNRGLSYAEQFAHSIRME